jgi:hypothetical protein
LNRERLLAEFQMWLVKHGHSEGGAAYIVARVNNLLDVFDITATVEDVRRKYRNYSPGTRRLYCMAWRRFKEFLESVQRIPGIRRTWSY